MSGFDSADMKKRMEGAIKSFASDLSGLRSGRANPSLLESVQVEAYGGRVPINQVGAVSTPEARLLVVQVWDAALTKAVEKAIAAAGLGLNPMAEGQVIRVPIPEMTQERRMEMVKVAGKYAEATKVAIRNVRRDGMDDLKKKEKDGAISKDEHHKYAEDIQKITDEYIKKVDAALSEKEKEITGN